MGAKLGVCFIVNNFEVGGLEKVVIDLVNRLDRDRFDVSVACVDGHGALFDRLELDESACLVLDKSRAQRTPIGSFDPRLLWRMRSFLERRGVSIVHAHNVAPLVYGGIGSRLGWRRPTMVYSEHNQIYSASRSTRRKFIFYIRLADQVVAVSHDLKRTLANKIHPTSPVRVIHNGIDGSRFAMMDGTEVRRELGVSPREILIGSGVVLSKQKGIPYLLRAAKAVLAKEPRARFAIAGDGPLREELERTAQAMNLGGRFHFLGYRSDMPKVIAALDVYVLPSLWEGLPLALLEAMAMGKPIVATSVGGNPEIVEDGVNGYIVPPKDIAALESALLRTCQDDVFRERVRNLNRRKFESQFSLQAMVSAHEKLFIDVATPRRSLAR
jgi:glycosyltransferase involved in cell wall biosynthesis